MGEKLIWKETFCPLFFFVGFQNNAWATPIPLPSPLTIQGPIWPISVQVPLLNRFTVASSLRVQKSRASTSRTQMEGGKWSICLFSKGMFLFCDSLGHLKLHEKCLRYSKEWRRVWNDLTPFFHLYMCICFGFLFLLILVVWLLGKLRDLYVKDLLFVCFCWDSLSCVKHDCYIAKWLWEFELIWCIFICIYVNVLACSS